MPAPDMPYILLRQRRYYERAALRRLLRVYL